MTAEAPVTYVEEKSRRRRCLLLPVVLALIAFMLIGIAVVGLGIYVWLLQKKNVPVAYRDVVAHFESGSIGADEGSGIPYWVWKALPRLFPEHFDNKLDWTSFGLVYRTGPDGKPEDLPLGFSKRNVSGVDLVWFNCGICHIGTYRESENAKHVIVPGMPSNTVDLYRFIKFFVVDASGDERLKPDSLFAAMEQSGAKFGPLDRLVWTFVVMPRLREGFIERRSRLVAWMTEQKPWGPGRVDSFNPYKLIQLGMKLDQLPVAERNSPTDFPPIFQQKAREKMWLHWDGNNNSLAERNLSAALGAGVTEKTIDHKAVERIADWLLEFKPPPSPHKPDPKAVASGRQVYMRACAECHGYQDGARYVYDGAKIGIVTPIGNVGTDPGRLNAYTEELRKRQLADLFAGTKYQFKSFVKTNGYANMPLDGLWLRGPYLHNGSVPTLRDLLKAPADRPKAFERASDVIDGGNGGFVSPACDPEKPPAKAHCYNTRLPGNGNGGHIYGTTLPDAEKDDLLAYLLTF